MALRVWLPLNGNLNNQGLAQLTSSGTPTFLDNGKLGKCISLTPRITFNGLPRLEKFTITFWLKVDSCAVDWADDIGFKSVQADGTSASDFRFEATISSRACSFHNNSLYAISQGSRILITEAQKGEWHHCGVSYDGTNLYTYIDGIKTYTDAGLGGYLIDRFHIGETNNMVGGMNDLRIYDECLSDKVIKEISKGLIAHYKLAMPGNENIILTSNKIISGGNASGITRSYESDGSMKIIAASGNGNYASIGFTENSNTNVGNKMAIGDKYTISCDIKVQEGTKYPTLFINSGNSYKQLIGPDIQLNKWVRIYYTSTWNDPGTGYGNISLHLGFSGAIGTYYFKNFKLEKGDLSPWIPAPTDQQYLELGLNNTLNQDVSGYGYNLDQIGTFSYISESRRYSTSTVFIGDCSHYLRRNYFSFLKPPFTFNIWAYQTSATGQSGTGTTTCQHIMSQGRDCGFAGFALYSESNIARLIIGTSTSGTNYVLNSGINILNNGWHMLTGTYDGTTAKLYVDGTLKASQTTTAEINWTESSGNFVIGKMAYVATTQTTYYFPFAGYLNDARVYTTALSDADILSLYKTGQIIDNQNNLSAYEFVENENQNNLLFKGNNAILDKTYKDGVTAYTQSNCQVTLTDDGFHIYRPPNLTTATDGNTMWGGLRLSIPSADIPFTLIKGHTYIILYDVKGQTTNAQVSVGWSNNMGWGGGGLNPTPTNVEYSQIPGNFQSSDYKTFWYKWTLSDDVYKVCTSSYSSFVEGQTYLSYNHFQVGWGYANTGALGTDLYLTNLRMYDITDASKPKFLKTGTIKTNDINEINSLVKIRKSNLIDANEFIEI